MVLELGQSEEISQESSSLIQLPENVPTEELVGQETIIPTSTPIKLPEESNGLLEESILIEGAIPIQTPTELPSDSIMLLDSLKIKESIIDDVVYIPYRKCSDNTPLTGTPTETRFMLQGLFNSGPVQLDAKTYIVDNTLNIDAYPVWGCGINSTIIKLEDGSNCDVINFVGAHICCELYDITIDCNGDNQDSGNGIVTTNPLTRLNSVEIKNAKESAILLDIEWAANACMFNNVRILYSKNGIEIKKGTTINILNCNIEQCENAILCNGGSSNINVRGGHFESNTIAIKALNGDFYIDGCYIYGSDIGIYVTDGKVIIGDIKFSNNTKNVQLIGFGSKSLYQEIDYDDGDNANMLLSTNITTVIIPGDSNDYSIPIQIQRSRGRLRSVKIIPHATITGNDTDYFSLSVYNWNSQVTEGLVDFKQGINWSANYVQEIVTKSDDTVIAAKNVVYQLKKINYGGGMDVPGLTIIVETTE